MIPQGGSCYRVGPSPGHRQLTLSCGWHPKKSQSVRSHRAIGIRCRQEMLLQIPRTQWQFNFVGFSVEENTNYFIDVYNLPPANINEDHSKIQKHLISPGSLWDPNITICNREFELEVNFTPSNFCSKYKIHLCDSHECDNSILHVVPTTKVYFFLLYNLAHFHPITAQKPVTILVVYSQEACLQHTVLSFAEFLQEYCQCNVIIDLWQKRKIAEIGTVQWLATQKEIADKVIFLCTTHSSASCDSTCESIIKNQKNSECMFTLALHFFCSDWKMNSSLCKYMVVSFSETHPDPLLPTPLNICPNYFLMKDIDSFCRDLYFSQSQKYKGGAGCSSQLTENGHIR
uniref:Interleukin 17 receptor B n=1 Tax=Naja naja TaxID=35670 RepID=A0A8C6YC29_NAJNA